MISYERIDRELHAYVTNSGLHPDPVMAGLTLDAARDTVPRLLDLARVLDKQAELVHVYDVEQFDHPCVPELGGMLQRHGSDKSSNHNYHHLYGHILGPRRAQQLVVLEVGLGSRNMDVVGAMGPNATVGASLLAWAEFLPQARIIGLDVDRRCLFQSDRVETYYVDQTDPRTFEALPVWPAMDLVIDDGLHSAHTNLATLNYALPRLAPGGWIVIEDIRESTLPLWHLVASMLPAAYKARVIYAHWGHLFAVHRLPCEP
jgi:hypothetical protein